MFCSLVSLAALLLTSDTGVIKSTRATQTAEYNNAALVDIEAFEEYPSLVIIPKDSRRIESIDVIIRSVVKGWKIFTITTPHRTPDIVFWSIRGNATERENLKPLLSLDDVDFLGNVEIAEAQDFSLSSNLNLPSNASTRLHLEAIPTPNPDIPVKLQQYAPWNLKVVSWAPTTQFIGNLRGYRYKANQPRQTHIYVIDNGLDPFTSKDFLSPHRGITWIGPPWALQRRTDDSVGNHGSCVSSLAAGLNHGVSKESKLVMFKSSQRLADVLWAFSTVRDRFLSRSAEEKSSSVILFTAAARYPSESMSYWVQIKAIMQELLDNDAIIVVPAGNYASRQGRPKEIDTIPARWSSPTFPLIVTGAVNDLRWRTAFTQGPENVTIYAPGHHVKCANKPDASGTSYAAAMVAGLLAYYLSFGTPPFQIEQGRTALNARNYLQQPESSWTRTWDGINVLWNGLDGASKGKLDTQ